MSGKNISNLNFEVILNDEKFTEHIQRDIKAAEKLNASLSKLLDIKKNVIQITSEEAKSMKRADDLASNRALNAEKERSAKARNKIIEDRMLETSERQRRNVESRLRTTKQLTPELSKQSRIFAEIRNQAAGILSIYAAERFVSSVIRVTGEFEAQKVALSSILQDAKMADTIFSQLKGLAVESPFQLKDLTAYSKQLSAFSVAKEDIFETTKMLADISAGLGVGMDRIILAYGQVKSAAFLRGQEVRQFTEAGIPILDELARKFTELEGRAVSAGEVFDKISKRLVSFEMVDEIFKDLTSEGGKFFQMQEVLSITLAGKVSNLKDAYEIMLSEIGESNKGILTGTVDLLRTIMENWEKLRPAINGVVVSMATYGAGLVLVAGYHKAMALGKMIQQFLQLRQELGTLNAVTKAFGITAKAAFGFVGLIIGVVTAIYTAVDAAGELNRELNKIANNKFSESERLVSGLDQLLNRLKNATQGSQNYREAISELNRRYGDYLPKLMSEADAYDNIAAAAKNAESAIRNKAKADAYERGIAEIEDKYGQKLNKAMESFRFRILNSSIEGVNKQNIDALISHYIKALEKTENENKSGTEVFSEVYKKFFKKDLKQIGYGSFINDLAKSYRELVEKNREFESLLNARFTTSQYETAEELEQVEEIKMGYDSAIESLKGLKLPQKEYNKELKKLEVSKLERLVELYEKLGRPEKAKAFQAELDALLKVPTGWQKLVADVFKGIGVEEKGAGDFGLWADETTSEIKYIEDLRKKYKNLDQDIKDLSFSNPEAAKHLQKQKQLIESIANALQISLNTESDAGYNKKSLHQIELERQISLIEKLKASYKGLTEAGISSNDAISILQSVYSNSIKPVDEAIAKNKDYEGTLKSLAEQLRKYDSDAADRILLSLDDNNADVQLARLKENKKAVEDYLATIAKWQLKDFGLTGDSLILDISKIASDLITKENEIDAKGQRLLEMRKEAESGDEIELANLRKALGEEVWNEYLKNGEDAIYKLVSEEKKAAAAISQEKVNDLANKYVKETYSAANNKDGDNIKIDFSDLGDKSYLQLRAMRIKLQKLMAEEPLKIPAEVTANLAGVGVDTSNMANTNLDEAFDSLKDMGVPIDESTQSLIKLVKQIQVAKISTSDFGEIIKKVFEGDLKQLSEEEFKKIGNICLEVCQVVKQLSSSLKELGDATGNQTLSDTANFLGDVADVLGNAIQGFAQGGWIGAAVAGVSTILDKVLDAITRAQSAFERAREMAHKYAMEVKSIEFDRLMRPFDTVFGEDSWGKFQTAGKKVAELRKEIELLTYDIHDFNNENREIIANNLVNKDEAFLGQLTNENTISLGKVGDFTIDPRTGWQKFWGTKKHLIQKFNIYDFFDEEGNLLGEELKAFYEQYGDSMEGNIKGIFEDLIKNYDLLTEATEQVTQYMSSVFGQVADEIADGFIESFKKTGEAAVDTGDIMNKVATNLAKSVIKQTILLEAFDEKTIESIATKLVNGEVEGGMALIDQAMQSAEQLAPVIQQILEKFEPYFNIDSEQENLGDGIKGITEDTANLLASYLNAIRADVSLSRLILGEMNTSIQSIVGILESYSVPTLLEYQAKIESNTYHIMVNTKVILDKMESVMTYDAGLASVRVYS